jgi:hypothetical protein
MVIPIYRRTLTVSHCRADGCSALEVNIHELLDAVNVLHQQSAQPSCNLPSELKRVDGQVIMLLVCIKQIRDRGLNHAKLP